MLVGALCVTYLLIRENRTELSTPETNLDVVELRDAALVQSVADLQELVGSARLHERELAVRSLVVDFNDRRTIEIFQLSNQVEPTAIRSEIQLVIIQKLATLDPIEALAQIAGFEANRRRPLAEVIFAEWSSSNLERAVMHAQSMDQWGKNAAMTGIVRSRSDLPKSEMFNVSRRLDNEQLLLDHYAEEMLDRQSIDDPKSALDSFFLQHGMNIDDLSDPEGRLLSYIVQSWIDQDGADSVLAVNSQLKTDADRAAMLSRLFSDVADNEAVLSVARSVSNVDMDILSRAIATWAQTDPEDSLQMASSFNESVTRTRLQKAVIGSWSRSDPKGLLSNLDWIPEGLKDWGHSEAMHKLARSAPDKAATELADMPNGPEKKTIASIIATNWAKRDPRAAFDWVQSNPEGSELTSFVLQGIVLSDPEMALDMALGQPVDENGVGFEAVVVGYLAKQDAENAIDMLHLARNPTTLNSFYRQIGSELVRQGKSGRAMELVQGESEELQAAYFRWIAYEWIRADAQDLLTKLDDLPSTSIQHLYAELMLSEHREKPFLQQDQVRRLEQYVTAHSPDDETHSHN